MNLIAILFLVGICMIAVEVFVPGGIIGFFGGAALIGGVVAAYSEYGSDGAIVATLVALVLVAFALWVEFKVLPKTRLGRRLFLDKRIEGVSEYSHAGDETIGQVGIAVTALAPTGFVEVGGQRLEAASNSGFIDRHQSVTVVGRDNFRLVVSKTQ